MAGEDGHAGDDGAGSAGAAVAGDFDAVAGVGEQVGVFDEVSGQLVVAWGAEVGQSIQFAAQSGCQGSRRRNGWRRCWSGGRPK
jgi:hypothetical protein